MSTLTTTAPTTTSTGRVALAVSAAAAVAVAGNALIAAVAAPLDAGGIALGLAPVAYISLTVLGVLAAVAGWTAIRRRAADPAATLRRLVPTVLVLSWIPDASAFLFGAGVVNVAALMLMHVVVAAALVPVLRRVLPV